MKKRMALVLAGMMFCGLLAGCGNTSSGSVASGDPSGADSAPNASDSAASGAESGAAADYPNKPITLTLGWAAGGGADLTSRAIMPYVEEILGQSIVITYNTGAGGELSFVELANDPADGYNWAWTVTPHLVSFPISRETQYQLEDICPIANIAMDPCVIAVAEGSDLQTLEDLVEYAKANPGQLNVGNGGTGGDDHIASLLFCQAADIQVNDVAYSEGTGSQISGLLGGHIDAAIFNASEASQYEGIRLLGVMASERVSIIPDIPTFVECGYDVQMSSDRGFSAPAGTDPAIVQKIGDAVEQAMQDPEFLETAENLNLILQYMGPEEYSEYLYQYREDLQKIYDSNPW